jgi:hypothetical protein
LLLVLPLALLLEVGAPAELLQVLDCMAHRHPSDRLPQRTQRVVDLLDRLGVDLLDIPGVDVSAEARKQNIWGSAGRATVMGGERWALAAL